MAPALRIVAALFAVTEGLRTREQVAADLNNEAYTFDGFMRDFGRSYTAGSAEYNRRADLFQASLLQIFMKNSRTRRSWTAGVHPFMDWTGSERARRLHGYKPSGDSRRAAKPAQLAALQTKKVASHDRVYGSAGDSFVNEAPPIRNQGACGSCWAIASVEAVEARLIKKGGVQLSPQALLDCVQNPKHCGGQGGCDGATPQLAFEFMRDNGLPLETNLPYSQHAADKCPIEPYPSGWARATLTGWRALPSNQAQPLMQALVEDGPVVVSVFAHEWYSYKNGIFDDCPKDAIPSHSVLATGYGVLDMSSGTHVSLLKYWQLQNSWGAAWGEQGSIRLVRQDDEDGWCGTDSQPQMGSACDDDPHNNVTVCGSCGILYDAVIPQVGELETPTPGSAREADKVDAIWKSYHAEVDDPAQPSTMLVTVAPTAETDASSVPAPENEDQQVSQFPNAAAATQSEEYAVSQAEAQIVPTADQLSDVAYAGQRLTPMSSKADRLAISTRWDSMFPPSNQLPDNADAGQLSAATRSEAKALDRDAHNVFSMGYHAPKVTDAMDAYEAKALQD